MSARVQYDAVLVERDYSGGVICDHNPPVGICCNGCFVRADSVASCHLLHLWCLGLVLVLAFNDSGRLTMIVPLVLKKSNFDGFPNMWVLYGFG